MNPPSARQSTRVTEHRGATMAPIFNASAENKADGFRFCWNVYRIASDCLLSRLGIDRVFVVSSHSVAGRIGLHSQQSFRPLRPSRREMMAADGGCRGRRGRRGRRVRREMMRPTGAVWADGGWYGRRGLSGPTGPTGADGVGGFDGDATSVQLQPSQWNWPVNNLHRVVIPTNFIDAINQIEPNIINICYYFISLSLLSASAPPPSQLFR